MKFYLFARAVIEVPGKSNESQRQYTMGHRPLNVIRGSARVVVAYTQAQIVIYTVAHE